MSGGTRIDFAGVLAAVYAQRVEEWREIAASSDLSRIGHRVASVLPKYLNREHGYCFPSDEDLATVLSTTPRSVGRGMNALDEAGLIERDTMVKHHQGSRAVGRMRRIFLSMPTVRTKRAVAKTASNERTETGPNERTTNERTGSNERTETSNERTETGRMNGQTSVRITSDVTSDNRTSDSKIRFGETPVSSHTHARDLSVHSPRKTVRSSRPNPIPKPTSWGDDVEFLSLFDEAVLDLTSGKEIGAGEIERITQAAFDRATDSRDDFMPIHWRDLLACRTNQTVEWFRYRASGLIHLSEAA